MMTPVSPSKLPVISVHLLQMNKIQHRKCYLKKQKAETSSKDNELDLLGHPPQVRLYNKKIQTNLEKSLGNSLNIHLQQ